ncbi:shikimate dehydrogenase [Acidithiobacillus ferrivorans]|uniref:Shikimate dehydrogenase (NADP(+)) n=1 Tax=Acidithiobacillus ferrivorans TaxID=160808 RepID=A0A7T5BHE5_9PROT|nr:shikimate dehydrogenase [Acidithiobacillus ferrivorans]QQD72533.1 shikimate dehydrogenase [Acidithiobacillus ferrivorans]
MGRFPQPDISNCWHPGGGTAVYGILGQSVTHSLSPWMHRLFAAQQDRDLVYVPFPVHAEAIATALAGLPALGVRGVNVTVPHKEAVLPLMQQLSATARAIGAVNTVCFTPSGMEGYNTDALGFQRALERATGLGWQQYPATVIGAGGAARAIVYALGHAGCPAIYLANRHLPRAESLAAQFPDLPVHPIPLDSGALSAVLPLSVLLINTSVRGLHGEHHPELDLTRMPKNGSVYDIVYNPLTTPLLRAARQAGLGAIDGLGMLVEQGAESFRIWTGTLPQTAAVEEILRRWLQIQHTLR